LRRAANGRAGAGRRDPLKKPFEREEESRMNAPVEPALRQTTLDDRYTATAGTVYLTGTQALVRLPILQRQRDVAAGLNTAGYVSGYRGSPLGGYEDRKSTRLN